MARLTLLVLSLLLLPACATTSVTSVSTNLPTPEQPDTAIKVDLIDSREIEIFINDKLILQQDLRNKRAINSIGIFDNQNDYQIKCEKNPGFNLSNHHECIIKQGPSELCQFTFWESDLMQDKYSTKIKCGDNENSSRKPTSDEDMSD